MEDKRTGDEIEVKGVTKQFRGVSVLSDINLRIAKGRTVGLLGPNGSGKSTLLSLLVGYSNPDQGHIKLPPRSRVAGVVNWPVFYEHLSGLRNLEVVCRIRNLPVTEACDVLKRVNLFQDRLKRFGEYSTGMKQRLAMSSCLLGEPDILVLDEPTSGVDIENLYEIEQILAFFKKRGTTLIIATHDFGSLERSFDDVVMIEKGKVKLIDTLPGFLAGMNSPDLKTAYLQLLRNNK